MFSVHHKGKVMDVYCERLKHSDLSSWYRVWLVDREEKILLGQTIYQQYIGWNSITNSSHDNYMGDGFATRRAAIEYMLKAKGIWTKDG